MEELITVCIPVYNGEKHIEEALRSIMKQTYQHIKIIVCDNASIDSTGAIVKKIMLEDSRIEYRKFDNYLDVNYSFLRAFKQVEDSDIVCLYHSDDWYYPNAIEKEYEYIKREGVGAVFGKISLSYDEEIVNIDVNRENLNSDYEIYDYHRYINEALIKGTIFPCPTLMTKMSVLMDVGLMQVVDKMISDMSFWLRFVRKYKVILINDFLMNYRVSEHQLSSQIFNRKRVTVSPQFILLDEELDKINQEGVFIVDSDSLVKYKSRRDKELKEIIKNLIDMGMDVNRYNDIYNKKAALTIENVAIEERNYLNLLYGRT